MKTYCSITLEITNLTEEKYNMLLDFLDDNKINYDETTFDEYTIDERSDEQKYDDYLASLADLHNDQVKMGLE